MAKGHSGNAFATDFTAMFNGITSEPEADSEVIKEEPTQEKAPAPAKKAETNKREKTEKKTVEVKPAPKTDTKLVEKNDQPTVAPKNPKSIVAAQNGEVYITIALLSIEDRDYLKFKAKELDLTTSEFFWSLVENDVKNITNNNIDLTDEIHQEVKHSPLAFTTSIKLKNEDKKALPKYAVKHRLPVKKYSAYLVSKARLSDADWI
jgi:hypothetical protein